MMSGAPISKPCRVSIVLISGALDLISSRPRLCAALRSRSMFFKNDEKKKAPAPSRCLPLRDIIVFPHMVVPLFVGREKSIAALEEAMARRQARSSSRRSGTPRPTIRRRGHLHDRHRRSRSSSSCGCPTAPSRSSSRASGARASRFVQTEEFFIVRGRGCRGGRRAVGRDRGADALGARTFRELRQAQQADPARDADLGADHRRSGAARRHHRRARSAQAERQAGVLETPSPAKRLERLSS